MSHGKNLYSRALASIVIVLLLILISSTASATAAESASFSGPYAYVTNYGSNTVSVIDTATNTVTANVIVESSSGGVAIAPDGKKAYITNPSSNTVSVIDTTTNAVISTVLVGGTPNKIVVSSDGKKVYVMNFDSDYFYHISVIDTATNKVTVNIPVESFLTGIAVSPDGTKIYVTSESGNFSIIDTTTNTVEAKVRSVGSWPMGIAVSPDGSKLYLTMYSNSISVIDTATNKIIATVTVGANPHGVAVNPAGTKVYVANSGNDTVSVIDTATNKVIATVTVGSKPNGVAVNPAGTKVYVANLGNDTVSVIDTATNKVIATVTVGNEPNEVAVGPAFQPVLNNSPTTTPVAVTNTESFTPTISWTYNDADGDPQQQYQLEVWTGSGRTGKNLWTTNQSSMYTYVTYAGTSLISGNTYYTCVRAFDGTNWGEWSETSFIPRTTKPIDTGFMPNPNGYQFPNPYTPTAIISQKLFRGTYGAGLVDNNYFAKEYYDKIYSKCLQSGWCFGMSASSLVLHKGNFNDTWNLTLNDDAYWSNIPLFIGNVADWIEYYQGRQTCPAVAKEKEQISGANNVYNTIKNRMTSGDWINDPMVMGFSWWDPYTDTNGNGAYDGGEPYQGTEKQITVHRHAVVPYKIEESPDHSSAKVFVYDSNNPGINNLYLVFNLSQNLVSPLWNEDKNEYVGDNDNYFRINARPIAAVSLSTIEQKPNEIPSYETISPVSHLLYTDSSGNSLGYSNGGFKDEISSAYEVSDWGDSSDTPEMYLIPTGMELNRKIIGLSDGIATADIFKTNTLITVQEQVSVGSVDELNIPKDASGVEFISGKETQSLSLTLERGQPSSVQIAQANISQIETGGSINLLNNNGNIVIQNHGQSRTCSLHLEQAGTSSNSDDSIRDIVVEGDSTVFIKPSNWNDIDNSEVTIEHDIGSDGIVDSTETIRPIAATVNFDPDTLNLGSGGNWVTAYIELPQGYSASNIDISSVLLNGVVPAVSDSQYSFVTNENEYLTDLDADGISERMLKFDREDVEGILKAGDQVKVTLTGKVKYENGISLGIASFEGSNLIKVIEKISKKNKTKK